MPENFGRTAGFNLIAGVATELFEVVLNLLVSPLTCAPVKSACLIVRFGRIVSRSLIRLWNCCCSAGGGPALPMFMHLLRSLHKFL